jgi:hypothetical protein
MSDICSIIKDETHKYLFESVQTSSGELYSEHRLKRRIYTYKSRVYPTGKVNEVGEIEYWFDAIIPRVNAEVKNLRLDSKYFMFWSKNPIGDFAAVYIANASLAEFMERTHRAEELSEATEDFVADGNVLFRKTDKAYEKCDAMNTFLTNTLARTVNETAVIERFYLTQSELRKKDGLFTNVDAVIEKCANTTLTPSPEFVASSSNKTYPLYELYRRTGEVSEKTLFKAQGKEGGDDKKFVLARIIVAGLTKGTDTKDEYVLFAEALSGKMEDHFKEAHRGPYKGKWWREGLYELLFDQQTAYNELTIEIMRAIPWNTSAILRSNDIQTYNNVRHALTRGSIIKSGDLQQVQINARINDAIVMRNSILAEMDSIANSYEVVRGVTPASGTPLGTTEMINENSNKLYDFLRKKLAIPYRYAYREFVFPQLVKELSGKDIIRLTGSEHMLEEFRRLIAECWYYKNLAIIGPHGPEVKDAIVEEKMQEMKRIDPTIKNTKEIWKEITPRIFCTIVGEAYNTSEVSTIYQLLPLETDPFRRAYMLDYILKSKGIAIPPPPNPAVQQAPAKPNEAPKEPEQKGQLKSPIPESEVPAEV